MNCLNISASLSILLFIVTASIYRYFSGQHSVVVEIKSEIIYINLFHINIYRLLVIIKEYAVGEDFYSLI
jgi:hypothetical protein